MMKLSVVVGVVLAVVLGVKSDPSQAHISDMFRNQDIEKVEVLSVKSVYWKQKSRLGVGGDRKENFLVCTYRLKDTDLTVAVFIQDDFPPDQTIKITGPQFKFGIQNDILFIVIINPDNKPFQKHFYTQTLQKAAYTVNKYATKSQKKSLSWIAGGKLKDFDEESSKLSDQGRTTISMLLRDQYIEQVDSIGTETISWKQGSTLGRKGDRSANFKIFTYILQSKKGSAFPVYIQDNHNADSTIKVTGSHFKYGMHNGIWFLVIIDPAHKPYKQRFKINTWIQFLALHGKQWTDIDLSWLIRGDYLIPV